MPPATTEPGVRVNGLLQKALLVITCIYLVRTWTTFTSSVISMGNDCSTQQLADLDNFRSSTMRPSKKQVVEEAPAKNNTEAPKSVSLNSGARSISITSPSTLPQLSDLTQQSDSPQCGEGTVYKKDFLAAEQSNSNQWNKIPKLIHQTSRFRCLTEAFNISTTKWSDWHKDGWSYYFHDDEAMQRMFEMNYNVFPLLKDVVENCLVSGTAKADLWRYLVLWHYGGIYSDLDTTPNNLGPYTFDSIATEEKPLEAFFIIESFHFLSQYFFAIQPKHPLMHHTIMATLHKLLALDDTSAFDASLITGPKALHKGFIHFLADAGITPDNGREGFGREFRHKIILTNATIVGTANYTVASYGHSKEADLWVWRYDPDLGARHKRLGYQAMGMEHFGKFKERTSGVSCQQAIKQRHHHGVATSFLKGKV